MNKDIDFSEIAPYSDEEFSSKLVHLVHEPAFEAVVRSVMPEVNYPEFAEKLSHIRTNEAFQHDIIVPFLEKLEQSTTDGITVGGLEHIDRTKSYTYMSNHRDIVLDASFLNYCFVKNGLPTSEIAIGNNLLIYDWITDLVKLNKSFIVKRNLRFTQALLAAKQLSAYIHYAIADKHESVWIAQREGRAKDSNDLTQESLIKMLGLEGGKSFTGNLLDANILPISISYEYDPNDYLKITEFLLRRRNPEFKKSQHDDLLSMETGILQPKGRVHFQLGECINPMISRLPEDIDKAEEAKAVCRMIDCQIHSNYHIYPINYIAYDIMAGENRFAEEYTSDDVAIVRDYISDQLAKVSVPDITKEEREYMRGMIYVMYANPLVNKLAAIKKC